MSDKPKSNRLKYLADKWLAGTISAEEKIEFDNWYCSYEDHLVEEYSAEMLDVMESDLYNQIRSRAGLDYAQPISNNRNFKKMWLWAASVVAVLGISLLYYTLQDTGETTYSANVKIVPGSDKGNLQLGDQTSYDLDRVKSGLLLNRDGVEIVKTKDGEVKFVRVSNEPLSTGDLIESSISTPQGGQYKIELSDGTRVWLNAASRMKFPLAFGGQKRLVELDGEAYFEVAKDADRPFIVKTQKEEVKVLGTHFNVNSYHDEPFSKVSLLEGNVEVMDQLGIYKAHLKPGQQTVNNLQSFQVESFIPEEIIAWKNGDFVFNNENLAQVMLKIGRWYNITVQVDPQIAHIQIWASISKKEQIDKVLQVVQLASDRISYRIEGRRVYMFPK